jgi:hypothetical protein
VNHPLTPDELSSLSVGSITGRLAKSLGLARLIKPQASSIFTELASDIIGRRGSTNRKQDELRL